MSTAGFESNKNRCTSDINTSGRSVAQRINFSVSFACLMVVSGCQDLISAHNDGSHHRIRMNL